MSNTARIYYVSAGYYIPNEKWGGGWHLVLVLNFKMFTFLINSKVLSSSI